MPDASLARAGFAKPFANSNKNLIWIASYPKSGDTRVGIFLHNLLTELADQSGGAQNGILQHVRESARENFERVIGKPIPESAAREIARTRPEVQRQMAVAQPAPFLVKTHMAIGHDLQYPTINLSVTQAAIQVVRNPLDVAVSLADEHHKSIDTAISILGTEDFKSAMTERTVVEFIGSWSQNVASWIGVTACPVHVIRYEDMLTNPMRAFSNLARFLRQSPTEAQLETAIANTFPADPSESSRRSDNKDRADASPSKGQQASWQGVLSPEHVRGIIQAHAPMMQRFGYLPPDCGLSVPAGRRPK